jgi:hypothetical protein
LGLYLLSPDYARPLDSRWGAWCQATNH